MDMGRRKLSLLLGLFVLVPCVISACAGAQPAAEQEHKPAELEPVTLTAGEKLQVVTTTNIVGDVVANVGGDEIELTTLMDIGVDPHTYVPTPADTAAIHDAQVVFANGAGLEADLEEMFQSASGQAVEIHLSDELALRQAGPTPGEAEDEHGHDGEELDPHVWFDVENVIRWVDTVERTLSSLDPANAEEYQANAKHYTQQLQELDTWIEGQVATIPEANRKLVTNHPAFGYLADGYGLQQVGAVYPVSPSAEPSAQDIAALQDAIRAYDVPAVFTESTVNAKLAEQIAADTGVKLVALYSGSLGGPGSGAETYIDLMRYNVQAIVEALK